MGMGGDFLQEPSSSKVDSGLPAWWFVLLGVLAVANFLMWFYPPLKSLPASVFSILSIAALVYNRTFKRYHRIVYAMVIPGLFTWTLVGHGFDWFATRSGYTGAIANLARWLAGGPYTQLLVALAIGLLAGISVPLLILEGYVLIHQDVVQAFSGLDVSTVRKILRSLFLNTGRAYYIVKDGEVIKGRPEGLSLIGGPGVVRIAPGNAVVFEQGGKLNRVVLSGVHPTKKHERIYKVIRLNSRHNVSALPTPTYPDSKTSSAPNQNAPQGGRNVRGLQSKDGIYIDLDLDVFFNIKRKAETPEDSVLAKFASQEVKNFPEAYLVDPGDVFKAATGFNHWELAVSELAENMLRTIVGQLTLDQLFEPNIRGKICRDLKNELNKAVSDDGIEVTHVSIGAIDIPEEVREKLQEQWLTEKQRTISRAQSQTEADALRRIERARRLAQMRMISMIKGLLTDEVGAPGEYSSRIVVSLRFIEALRDIASHPSTRPLFPFGIPFDDIDAFRTQLLEGGKASSEKEKKEPN